MTLNHHDLIYALVVHETATMTQCSTHLHKPTIEFCTHHPYTPSVGPGYQRSYRHVSCGMGPYVSSFSHLGKLTALPVGFKCLFETPIIDFIIYQIAVTKVTNG